MPPILKVSLLLIAALGTFLPPAGARADDIFSDEKTRPVPERAPPTAQQNQAREDRLADEKDQRRAADAAGRERLREAVAKNRLEPAQLVGIWNSRNENEAFGGTIVMEQGTGALSLHSDRRVWEGTYNPDPESRVLATFTYRPAYDEMNPDIPGWARRELDQELVWTIKLVQDGRAADGFAELRWERGEVEWTETDDGLPGEVKIVGPGPALVFPVAYAPVLQLEQEGGVVLSLKLARDQGISQPPGVYVQNLLQFQQFFLTAHVPPEQADEIGDELDVAIEGRTSGETASITLYRNPAVPGRPVIYQHQFAASLGDCDALMNPSYEIGALDPAYIVGLGYSALTAVGLHDADFDAGRLQGDGSCIDFAPPDREQVTFSFKDASLTLQFFDTWAHFTVAQQEAALAKHEALYAGLLQSGTLADDKRQDVKERLQMIRNYRDIVAQAELTELHKILVGQIYVGGDNGPGAYVRLRPNSVNYGTKCAIQGEGRPRGAGLLHVRREDIDAFLNGADCVYTKMEPASQWLEAIAFFAGDDVGRHAEYRVRNAEGIGWTSPFEKELVARAVHNAGTDAMNSIAREFITGTTLAMYNLSANASLGVSAADLYLLLTGTDHFGRKVGNLEYYMTAIGVTSEIVLGGADFAADYLPGRSWMKRPGKTNAGRVSSLSQRAPQILTHLSRRQVGSSKKIVRSIVKAVDGKPRVVAERILPDTLPKSVKTKDREFLPRRFAHYGRAEPIRITVTPKVKFDPTLNLDDIARPELVNAAENVSGAYSGFGTLYPGSEPVTRKLHAKRYHLANANYLLSAEDGLAFPALDDTALMSRVLDEAETLGVITPEQRLGLGATAAYDRRSMGEYYRASGKYAMELDPDRLSALTIRDINAAVERGYWVEVEVNFGRLDSPETRPILIEDILTADDGRITKVRAYDPGMNAVVDFDPDFLDIRINRDPETGGVRPIAALDVYKGEPAKTGRRKRFDADPEPTRETGYAAAVEDAPDQAGSRPAANLDDAARRPASPSDDARIRGLSSPEDPEEFTLMSYDDPTSGEIREVRLGRKLGEGRTSKAFVDLDDPDRVIRITAGGEEDEVAELVDEIGRRAFDEEGSEIARDIVSTVEQGETIQIGAGITLQRVERAKGRLAADYLADQDGEFTPGQALAFEAASRELNRNGYVWLDNHKNNWHLIAVDEGADQWRVQIVDTGGILPIRNKNADPAAAAEQARRIQAAANNPAAARRTDDASRNGIMLFFKRREYIAENGGAFVDISEFPDHIETLDALEFNPEIGYRHPSVRELAALDDEAFKQRYRSHHPARPSAGQPAQAKGSGGRSAKDEISWIAPGVIGFSKDLDDVSAER